MKQGAAVAAQEAAAELASTQSVVCCVCLFTGLMRLHYSVRYLLHFNFRVNAWTDVVRGLDLGIALCAFSVCLT